MGHGYEQLRKSLGIASNQTETGIPEKRLRSNLVDQYDRFSIYPRGGFMFKHASAETQRNDQKFIRPYNTIQPVTVPSSYWYPIDNFKTLKFDNADGKSSVKH